MTILAPVVIADRNKCINCNICEIVCHAWHHVHGCTVGNIIGPVLPRLGRKNIAENIFASPCRQSGDECDLCQGREQGPICVEFCPEKALRMATLPKDRREKIIKAAQCMSVLFRSKR